MQDNKQIVRNSVLVNSIGIVNKTVIANKTLMQNITYIERRTASVSGIQRKQDNQWEIDVRERYHYH